MPLQHVNKLQDSSPACTSTCKPSTRPAPHETQTPTVHVAQWQSVRMAQWIRLQTSGLVSWVESLYVCMQVQLLSWPNILSLNSCICLLFVCDKYRFLVTSGNFWQHLASSGNFWQLLATDFMSEVYIMKNIQSGLKNSTLNISHEEKVEQV